MVLSIMELHVPNRIRAKKIAHSRVYKQTYKGKKEQQTTRDLVHMEIQPKRNKLPVTEQGRDSSFCLHQTHGPVLHLKQKK